VSPNQLILVTGASGYIGGKLIPHLLECGYRVRCLVRDASSLQSRPWFSNVEISQCDLIHRKTLHESMEGVSKAYYLVHSMAQGKHYHRLELAAAANFAAAASTAGVEHIIYLGGLADPDAKIGLHMRSRIETGDTLRQGSVPVTEFRASLIIGPGSISFEMIRYLTEQIPFIMGPRWLHNACQPIAVQDVLNYLLAALDTPACRGKILEIGGPQILAYAASIKEYARLRGLKRHLITFPRLPIWLMAYWVDKLTPVPGRIAAPLIDGMRSESVVRDDTARKIFPGIQPIDYQSAVASALSQLSPDQVEPVWRSHPTPSILKHAGFLIDFQQAHIEASPQAGYLAIIRMGGKKGWLYLNGLWKLRGWIDRLLGGPGMRGHPGEDELSIGQVIDFYRVEALEAGCMLRLRSELKAPGEGWMEWEVKPLPEGGAQLSQTAFFAPKGAAGFLYWYGLYPLHRMVFKGLVKKLALRASEISGSSSTNPI
jgi:uncharacterized protein YbjT (DUF2867 family)